MLWIGFGAFHISSSDSTLDLDKVLSFYHNNQSWDTETRCIEYPPTGIAVKTLVDCIARLKQNSNEDSDNVLVLKLFLKKSFITSCVDFEPIPFEYVLLVDCYFNENFYINEHNDPITSHRSNIKSKCELKKSMGMLLSWLSMEKNLRFVDKFDNVNDASYFQKEDCNDEEDSLLVNNLISLCKSHSNKTDVKHDISSIYSKITSGSTIHDALFSAPNNKTNSLKSSSSQEAITQQTNILLPDELMLKVMLFLDAISLQNASNTCKMLKSLSLRVIPGLKLNLFPHQIRSVHWMLLRERNITHYPHPCYRSFTLSLSSASKTECDDDNKTPPVILSCNMLTGDVRLGDTVPTILGCPGGFLCDEPGLGKTITMLAVILRKLGCIATVNDILANNEKNNHDNYHKRHTVISTHFNSNGHHNSADSTAPVNDYMVTVNSKATSAFRQSSRNLKKSMNTVSVETTMPSTIQSNATNENKKNTNKSTPTTIPINNNNNNNHHHHLTSSSSSPYNFRHSSSQHTHMKRQRVADLSVALSSPTSLIIVPEILLNQWREQIDKYVHSYIMTNERIYIDDDLTRPLPEAKQLAEYYIIVTTHKRLTLEWKTGRPLVYNDIKPMTYMDQFYGKTSHTKTSSNKTAADVELQSSSSSVSSYKVSSLLGLVFYRVIFDEGHSLGRNNLTSSLLMTSCLLTKNKWILSGTPTPDNSVKALQYLYQQFKFLKHPLFTTTITNNNNHHHHHHENRSNNGELFWKTFIVPTFRVEYSNDHIYGAAALTQLLSQNMVRHTKANIPEIPPPVYKITPIHLTIQESSVYNFFACSALTNLVLTDLDYTTPGKLHKDSLLNIDNRDALTELIFNLRIATCGAGRARLTLSKPEAVLTDVHDKLLKKNCSTDNIEKVRKYIVRALDGEKTVCEKCGVKLEMLLITPCGHLYCCICMREMGDYCIQCQEPFDWNELQRLQPGFGHSSFIFNQLTANNDDNNNNNNNNNSSVNTVLAIQTSTTISSSSSSDMNTSTTEILPVAASSSAAAAANYKDDEINSSAKIDYLVSKINKLDSLWKRNNQKLVELTNSCNNHHLDDDDNDNDAENEYNNNKQKNVIATRNNNNNNNNNSSNNNVSISESIHKSFSFSSSSSSSSLSSKVKFDTRPPPPTAVTGIVSSAENGKRAKLLAKLRDLTDVYIPGSVPSPPASPIRRVSVKFRESMNREDDMDRKSLEASKRKDKSTTNSHKNNSNIIYSHSNNNMSSLSRIASSTATAAITPTMTYNQDIHHDNYINNNSSSSSSSSSSIGLNYVPKIVIFSEFSYFLLRLSIEFDTRGVSYSYLRPGMSGSRRCTGGTRGRGERSKTRELLRFKTLPSVRVLLLSSEGSHGLDLSFVTHIFLINALLDSSLENQVVSRAYRMGATRSVIVEQIYTTSTIEEHLFLMKNDHACSNIQTYSERKVGSSSHKKRKLHASKITSSSATNSSEGLFQSNKSNSSSNSNDGINDESTKMITSKQHRLVTAIKLLESGLSYQCND